jgi:hypothetical protein
MFRFTGFVMFVLLFTTSNFSTIINVPGDQPSIQEGINAAINGDTVLVADNTYYENINFKGKSITVASDMLMDNDSTHRDNTIINGSFPFYPDSGSVVSFVSGEDSSSILKGFTITGGTGTISLPGVVRVGGGIVCLNSGPKICDNRILQNNVNYNVIALGGGIGAGPPTSTASVVIKNNLLMDNTVEGGVNSQGAGIYLSSNGRVSGNYILDNLANSINMDAYGGGLYVGSVDSVIVTGNYFLRNKALTNTTTQLGIGGGMFFFNDSVAFVRILGNTVAENEVSSRNFTAGAGVGIERTGNLGGDVLFANNLIYNNYYSGFDVCHGGGLYLNRSIVKVINNTITGNTASFGGGISCSHSDSTTLFMNNICWGDTATQSPGEIDLYLSSPPTFVYNDIQDTLWPGEGNIDADPQLVADSLANSSPCIGAGILAYDFGGVIVNSPSVDINGRMRPYPAGSDPDMGAWESKLANPVPVGIEPQPAYAIPQTYSLEQNYPNPFNPKTTIEFELPHTEFVTLKVYNISGEEVTTLVLERLHSGSYRYEWDASGLASGVYLYCLEAGKFNQSKKLLLLK